MIRKRKAKDGSYRFQVRLKKLGSILAFWTKSIPYMLT